MATNSPSDSLNEEQLFKFKQYYTDVAYKLFIVDPVYFSPLIINNCNGMYSCPFSEASINFEKAGHRFPAFMWYGDFFKYIGDKLGLFMSNTKKLKGKETMKRFIDAFMSMTSKHEKCLRQLKEVQGLCEEKIKCILAIHFFQPLSNGATCIVDKNSHCVQCPLCKEPVIADLKKTSFGNHSVWYGQCDILVQHSIVNVSIDAIEGLSFEELDMDLDMSFCSKIVEDNTGNSIRKNKSAYQAIAQTIVNAFVVSNSDKLLFNKFIPSFLVTETAVRILMYNCKLDILLSSDEFFFWHENGKLCMETVMFIWAAMNSYVSQLEDTTGIAIHLEKTPVSKFKEVVGEAYQVYLNDVCRPMVTDNKKREFKLNIKSEIHNSDFKLIADFGMKLFQQAQNISSKNVQQPKHELTDQESFKPSN